mmetsp:Transcript_8211/g.17830  ORF Transcript_8211/g.17830 Transcript_8211/m.17830 type:complete len:155 (-) Transcript_8211:309-773(-)
MVLLLKFQATNMNLGSSRIRSGSRPPQDAALFAGAGPQDFDGSSKRTERAKKNDGGKSLDRAVKAKAAETRAARIVMNDLENIPLGLVAAWAGVLCGGGRDVHVAAVWAFCAGRCVHSYAYLYARQPMRAIGFLVGLLATFVLAGNALFAAASL